MANSEHVDVVKEGEAAIRVWREQHPDERLDLVDADLRGADLQGADLATADLHGAGLGGTNLGRANLSHVRGAHQTYFLETVQLLPPDPPNTEPGQQPSLDTLFGSLRGSSNDVRFFENCIRPLPERRLDWENLRVVGRLPLFGASYTALILIPILFYGLALYNDQAALVRAWAEQVMAQPDHILYRLASLVLARLHPRPIPQHLHGLLSVAC
jgi:hypothetical protein